MAPRTPPPAPTPTHEKGTPPMKRCITILLALLILTACAAGGQSGSPETESGPSSVSEPSSVPGPVPAQEPDQPPQEEINPDFGWGPEDERINQLIGAVQDNLLPQLPETSYSYLTLYQDGEDVVLKIGVLDEPAADACLAAWTGEKWDKLVKEPALYSRALRAEFVEKAEQLDFGPDARVTIGAFPPMWDNENVVFGVMLLLPESYASGEEPNPWKTAMPQQLADLAKEMGIPEDVIDYSFGYIIDPEPRPGSEPPVG